MSKESLELLVGLLEQVQISVAHPDFATIAQSYATAKAEVAKALAAD